MLYIYDDDDDDQSRLMFFSSLFFFVIFWLFVTYGIDLVSIPRYYFLVSYRSHNYGIEPSLVPAEHSFHLLVNTESLLSLLLFTFLKEI